MSNANYSLFTAKRTGRSRCHNAAGDSWHLRRAAGRAVVKRRYKCVEPMHEVLAKGDCDSSSIPLSLTHAKFIRKPVAREKYHSPFFE